MRIPLTPDLHINKFSGGTITELESGTTNGVFDKNESGIYLTQRPAIDISADASQTVADSKGRGVYYWADNSAIYFVNDDTLYKSGYGTVVDTITAGTKKCYFFSLGGKMIVLDPENNQGHTVTSGDVLTTISDTDFPPNQTPAVGLAYGGAVLDGTLYVLGEDGTLYGSDLEDATAWNALNFINAERDVDGGVYLGKHHDHLVAIGPKSIEFFYDAANSTGSPLARRQDVYHTIGCASGESVWENGDNLFFVGSDENGSIGVYLIDNFQIIKVSTSTIDSFLSQAIVKDSYSVVGSGVSAQGHTFYIITTYVLSGGVISPETSLVFDAVTKKWGIWETTINSMSKFPVVGSTSRTSLTPRYAEGMFYNGDLFTVNDAPDTEDTLLASTYVVTDYVETGYVTETGGTGTSITMKARTGQFDVGSMYQKLMNDLTVVGETTDAANTITVRWSDNNSANFNTGRAINTDTFSRLFRMGAFRRRNFEIEYADSETLKLYALEGNISQGFK